MLNIPLWQWALYGLGAVFLVGAWFLWGKIIAGAEWAAAWVLRRWGKERHAASVVAGLSVFGIVVAFFWFGGRWWLLLSWVVAFLLIAATAVWAGVDKKIPVWVFGVGAVVLWHVLSLVLPGGESGRRVDRVGVEKSSVEKTGRTSDGGCLCFDGAVCIGPRGGKYCITQAGTKRYLTSEDQQRMQKN